MRNPVRSMSLDSRMPNSVQSWLGQELELRGIDAMIYTRYILSILQRDSMELDYIDAYAEDLPVKKDIKPKGKRRHMSKCRKSRCLSSDSEELKKTAAVECLLSVTDEDSGIEDLVEELCVKLKELNTDAVPDKSVKPSLKRKQKKTTSSPTSDPTQKYYDAFPSLTANNTITEGTPPVTCISPTVWDSGKLKIAETNDEPSKSKEKSCTPPPPASKQQPSGKQRDDNPPRYKGRGSKEKAGGRHPAYKQRKSSERNDYRGVTTADKQLGYKTKPRHDDTKHQSYKDRHDVDRRKLEVSRPKFILPRAPVLNKSPPSIQPEVTELKMSQVRQAIERQLSEKAISKINEPSSFSHFSKPFPKVKRSSNEGTRDGDFQTWYTEPIGTLYSDSPIPGHPLYLRRPSSEVDFTHFDDHMAFQYGSLPANYISQGMGAVCAEHFLQDCKDLVSGRDSADSTVLVSGILEQYFNSDDDDNDDNNIPAEVSFALDYSSDHLGAPLLYGVDDELDSVFHPSDATDTQKLVEILKGLKNELDSGSAGEESGGQLPIACPQPPIQGSRFMSMFQADNEEHQGVHDDSEVSISMPLFVETLTNDDIGWYPWQCSAQTWGSVLPAGLTPTLWTISGSSPSAFWNVRASNAFGFVSPFEFPVDWQTLLSSESLRHLWDINLSTVVNSPVSFTIPGLMGTSPPAPQGLLKICNSLDYNPVSFMPTTKSLFVEEDGDAKGLWDTTHWGMVYNESRDCQRHMKTSTSTDSFFLHTDTKQNKTCRVKLLYRQRSWSFDEGFRSHASLFSNVYLSPHSMAYADGVPTECLHEDLLFSPDTHFRPIQTPFSGTPDQSSDKMLSSHVPDGYQQYKHDNNNTEFIPKFRLLKGMEKYAQTDTSTPQLEAFYTEEFKNNHVPAVYGSDSVDVKGISSDHSCEDDDDDTLQFTLDLDSLDDNEDSDLGTLAETLTQNAINKLLEDGSIDIESESCMDRAPSLSQSKFARLWKDPKPYLMTPLVQSSSDSDIKKLMVDEQDKSITSEKSVDSSLLDTTQSTGCPEEGDVSGGGHVGGADTYSTKFEHSDISAIWKGEDPDEPPTRLVSPFCGLQRENSIWSVGSESESEGAVCSYWKYDATEGGDEGMGDVNQYSSEDNKDRVGVMYASDLEQIWLQTDVRSSGQMGDKDSGGHSVDYTKKPCVYFMEGHCKKDDCRFAHDVQRVTCRYWDQGSCYKGSTCPFLHGYHSFSSSPVLVSSSQDKATNSTRSKLRKTRALPRRLNQPSYLIHHRSGARRKMLKTQMEDVRAAKK